jgi:hypothetical protein
VGARCRHPKRRSPTTPLTRRRVGLGAGRVFTPRAVDGTTRRASAHPSVEIATARDSAPSPGVTVGRCVHVPAVVQARSSRFVLLCPRRRGAQTGAASGPPHLGDKPKEQSRPGLRVGMAQRATAARDRTPTTSARPTRAQCPTPARGGVDLQRRLSSSYGSSLDEPPPRRCRNGRAQPSAQTRPLPYLPGPVACTLAR